MNALTEQGIITEMTCGPNFAYVLENNSHFLPTEYKVLQSQTSDCFIKCMKMLYNGRIQLYYLTDAYKPLSALFSSMDAERFITITAHLLDDIIEVKSNGFLSCQNIDLSYDHIYVDTATYKVSLVYLPLSQRMFEDYAAFENELRTGLVKLISGLEALSSARTLQLSADLSNGAMTLEDLCNRIKGKSGSAAAPAARVQTVQAEKPGEKKAEQAAAERDTVSDIRVVSLNAPARVEIRVTKDEFVIGKKEEKVDGVISFNDKISRVHCRISRNGNRVSITDLHSANGTYVNHVRLQPDRPAPIKNGDVVRLANSDFQIVIS